MNTRQVPSPQVGPADQAER